MTDSAREPGMDLLFQPLNIKSLHLPNRIVIGAHDALLFARWHPTSDVAAYYRRRAEGGVGLLISEGTTIARPFAAYDPHIPRFHGARRLPAGRRSSMTCTRRGEGWRPSSGMSARCRMRHGHATAARASKVLRVSARPEPKWVLS